MGEIVAFANTHPILASIVVALLIAVLVYEVRLKGTAVTQVSPGMAVQLINKGATVVDVRPPEAYAAGHIVNAKNIPLATIASEADPLRKKKDRIVLTVCDNGLVARRAADLLRKAGYESAFSLKGGLAAWRADNMPLAK